MRRQLARGKRLFPRTLKKNDNQYLGKLYVLCIMYIVHLLGPISSYIVEQWIQNKVSPAIVLPSSSLLFFWLLTALCFFLLFSLLLFFDRPAFVYVYHSSIFLLSLALSRSPSLVFCSPTGAEFIRLRSSTTSVCRGTFQM